LEAQAKSPLEKTTAKVAAKNFVTKAKIKPLK